MEQSLQFLKIYKKACLIAIVYSLYKNRPDFLDTQYGTVTL